jgi:hypothetical protein
MNERAVVENGVRETNEQARADAAHAMGPIVGAKTPRLRRPELFEIVTTDGRGRQTRAPVADEAAARAAWIAARAVEGCRYAGVERTKGPVRGRLRCEWTFLGTFFDRTDAHREEMTALVARLTAEAPPGFTAEIRDEPLDWCVVFRGSRTDHKLMGACSDEARVLAHWHGYRP